MARFAYTLTGNSTGLQNNACDELDHPCRIHAGKAKDIARPIKFDYGYTLPVKSGAEATSNLFS